MTLANDLGTAGLSFSGSPPSTQVVLGSTTVTVAAEESGTKVVLSASVHAPGGSIPGDLSGPSLSADGDTTFRHENGSLVGRRTLVEPSIGAAYDAVFELAKSTASLLRLFGDMAELAGAGEVPVPMQAAAATTDTMVAAAPVQVAAPAWAPTHSVPGGGLRTWPQPDPKSLEGPRLDPGLPIQVAERKGAWARVVASNGWSGWVDGRLIP